MEFGSPENTNCAQFSVCIDQSVLDDLPPLDDIDWFDDDSDDDSCSSSSEDTSIGSDNLTYASYLSIIYEETEEDLLSLIGDNDADNESFCRITVPRSDSLDSYLAKNQRRSQEQTIDLTLHVTRHSSKHFDNDSPLMRGCSRRLASLVSSRQRLCISLTYDSLKPRLCSFPAAFLQRHLESCVLSTWNYRKRTLGILQSGQCT
jgi:hypothetical protein